MKHIFIAGNWKSNKTSEEANVWLETFRAQSDALHLDFTACTVVVCPPYLVLPTMAWQLKSKPLAIALAAQDVSAFDSGAYTGEVTAVMVKGVAEWVIIGHSERRKYFGETDELLQKKTEKAKAAGLNVIYCVQDDSTPVPANVDVVAYEPVWAIGTGKTDTPENANAVVTSIKAKIGAKTVLYGGSVTADNVASFTAQPAIDGVLPGGASLDPVKYAQLVANATSHQ